MSAELSSLFRANHHLLSERTDMPLGMAVTFLGVTIFNPKVSGQEFTQGELGAKLGVHPSSLSGYLSALGQMHRNRPGMNLIETFPNPFNRRSTTFHLTHTGEALAGQLEAILRGER